MLPAKRRSHLSNVSIETLFLLDALKLAVKNFYEYEQEIKFAGEKMINCNCISYKKRCFVVF